MITANKRSGRSTIRTSTTDALYSPALGPTISSEKGLFFIAAPATAVPPCLLAARAKRPDDERRPAAALPATLLEIASRWPVLSAPREPASPSMSVAATAPEATSHCPFVGVGTPDLDHGVGRDDLRLATRAPT